MSESRTVGTVGQFLDRTILKRNTDQARLGGGAGIDVLIDQVTSCQDKGKKTNLRYI